MVAALLEERYGVRARFSQTSTICIERVVGTGSSVDLIRQRDNPYLAGIGLRVEAPLLPQLIDAGRAVKRSLDRDVYGTIIWEQVGPLHQRNVTIFADGEVDRSPCGSGTSARLALLADDGALAEGDVLRHDSIVDTTFHARIVGTSPEGVLTEVEGTEYRTGEHRFVLDERNTLGTGFVLR